MGIATLLLLYHNLPFVVADGLCSVEGLDFDTV